MKLYHVKYNLPIYFEYFMFSLINSIILSELTVSKSFFFGLPLDDAA